MIIYLFKDKKLQEATQTIESLRKSILELQVSNKTYITFTALAISH